MMLDMAHKTLELFRCDERAADRFATLVIRDDTARLRRATAQLPELSRRACWRLTQELEYMAKIYG